jgi:hypothetical protein
LHTLRRPFPLPLLPIRKKLKAISRSLVDVRQRVDQIAGQIATSQEQMTRDITSKLQAAQQDILENLSAPAQRCDATAARKPLPLTPPLETQPPPTKGR